MFKTQDEAGTKRRRMQPMKHWMLCSLLAANLGALVGCQSKGPIEEAGEKVDEAVQDSKRAVEDVAD
jgi:hypothetical protein